jgi:PPK2 family polyphosphate:nucleotide phosphotransferase
MAGAVQEGSAISARATKPSGKAGGPKGQPGPPHYRVEPGRPVRLAGVDPGQGKDFGSKESLERELKRQRARIRSFQPPLYAEGEHSLLVVLQAMDTGGKDGTIKRVFRGVNPQGCQVVSFRPPSDEELRHDFLWRVHQRVPAKGMIGVFNRSHYEDVLIARVKDLVPEEVWRRRYDIINDFERALYLDGGVTILKFFLHISKAEQKRRLKARLEDPAKRWKFNPGDLEERKRWDDYQVAYEDAINNCSTAHAPWHVVPADSKPYRNLVVARTIADALEALDPRYPEPEIDPGTVSIPD